MRYRISSDTRTTKYLFLAIGIGLVVVIINSLGEENFNPKDLIGYFAFLLPCALFYYFFDRTKTVEYDNQFMYVIWKNEEEKVALRNIIQIKLTMTSINDRSLWKISYHDQSGAKKSVRFLPKWFHQHFEQFKSLVQKENKKVVIQNWASSLDFDQ